jgi:PACS-1 cytosolic sorting protein
MRLGKKKEKDKDLDKDASVDGIARLICSTKQANQPLRGKLMV